MNSGGSERQFSRCLRVGVVVDDIVVLITMSDSPVVLSGYRLNNAAEVLNLVARNITDILQEIEQRTR